MAKRIKKKDYNVNTIDFYFDMPVKELPIIQPPSSYVNSPLITAVKDVIDLHFDTPVKPIIAAPVSLPFITSVKKKL